MLRTLLGFLALLSALALASAVRAQPEGGDAPIEQEPPAAEKTEYDRHMDNGVKLYREANYAGAIAEFRAAYRAKPNASPLINQALSYKKLSDYFAAIEVLEKALDEHADTMKPEHREAAHREIRELKELIAWVEVELTPADAQLTIDGKPTTARRGTAVPLGPGPHVFRAEAKGYKTEEHRVDLVSGRGNPTVRLALEPTSGELGVVAASGEALIEVDGKAVGRGGWTGRLTPGVHVVRVITDDEPETVRVLVLEGGRHSVRQTDSGDLESDSLAPDDEEEDPAFGPPKILRGFYFTGSGTLLTAFANARGFTGHGTKRWGAAGGLNLGYRVAEWAGFEVMGQYSDVRVEGKVNEQLDTEMQLKSIRLGGMMRIMLPGRSLARFVGNIGLGVAIERLRWQGGAQLAAALGDPGYNVTDGFQPTPFGEVDLGVEVELSNILLDLVIQHTILSTKHFDVELPGGGTTNVFETRPLLYFGPQLRVGYGIW